VVQFSAASYSANESAGSVTITVTRSGNTAITSSVQYATANGTAASGSDYNAASGTLTFAPGESAKSFNLVIINDTVKETTETFNVVLSNASNANLGTPGITTVSILDDDKKARIPRAAPSSKRRNVFTLASRSDL